MDIEPSERSIQSAREPFLGQALILQLLDARRVGGRSWAFLVRDRCGQGSAGTGVGMGKTATNWHKNISLFDIWYEHPERTGWTPVSGFADACIGSLSSLSNNPRSSDPCSL